MATAPARQDGAPTLKAARSAYPLSHLFALPKIHPAAAAAAAAAADDDFAAVVSLLESQK